VQSLAGGAFEVAENLDPDGALGCPAPCPNRPPKKPQAGQQCGECEGKKLHFLFYVQATPNGHSEGCAPDMRSIRALIE